MEIKKRRLVSEDTYITKKQRLDTVELPADVVILLMRFILNSSRFKYKESVKNICAISRLGTTCTRYRFIEKQFWAQVSPISRIRTWFHLSYMPKKYRNDSKQIYLYEHFSCARCGKKAITQECSGCNRQVCHSACELQEHICSSGSSFFYCPDCMSSKRRWLS